MLQLRQSLVRRLRDLRVRIDVPDANTVVLRNLPPNGQFFNKERTNLLLKRPAEGLPFVPCVDEDLQYTGADQALGRAFATGTGREGWRPVLLREAVSRDLQTAVQNTLRALGFDGAEPHVGPTQEALPDPRTGRLLGAFTTPIAAADGALPTLGRDDQINDVLACLTRSGQARLAVIVGESGVGKTNLLDAVARRLSTLSPPVRLLSLNAPALMAAAMMESDRARLLGDLLEEARPLGQVIVAVEHLELLVSDALHGQLALARFLDSGGRMVGTVLPSRLGILRREPLVRRLGVFELEELDGIDTLPILQQAAGQLARHHDVQIDAALLRTCLRASGDVPGTLPGKAIALLDAAAARAAVAGSKVLTADDVLSAAARTKPLPEAD